MRMLGTATGLLLASLVALPIGASAHSVKHRDGRPVTRDCTPYNGPFGYYGNPWCDGGWKYAEDYPPGTGGYFDVFQLPQLRRHHRAYGYWD